MKVLRKEGGEEKEGGASPARTEYFYAVDMVVRIRALVLVHVHGEDFVGGVFVGIDVNHPVENDGMEFSASGGARFLGGNRSV